MSFFPYFFVAVVFCFQKVHQPLPVSLTSPLASRAALHTTATLSSSMQVTSLASAVASTTEQVPWLLFGHTQVLPNWFRYVRIFISFSFFFFDVFESASCYIVWHASSSRHCITVAKRIQSIESIGCQCQ
jgi:hypothetical protein